MSLSLSSLYVIIHGFLLCGIYVLLLGQARINLWNVYKRLSLLYFLCILCWLIVISGTYLAYPYYRANIPTSHRTILLSTPSKLYWHKFAFEWKEHVGWFAPILLTAVTFIISNYGIETMRNNFLRKITSIIFVISGIIFLLCAVLGILVTKVATE